MQHCSINVDSICKFNVESTLDQRWPIESICKFNQKPTLLIQRRCARWLGKYVKKAYDGYVNSFLVKLSMFDVKFGHLML